MKNKQIISLFMCIPALTFAQKSGELGEEQVVITKDKKIEFPVANRIFEKIPSIVAKPQEKQLRYVFSDHTPSGVVETVFNPAPIPIEKKDIESESYNNFLKIGFGNFGRIFGDGYIHSSPELPTNLGLHVQHNSTNKGPVGDKNSAMMDDHIKLYGKHTTEKLKVSADVQYDRNQYFFYGYKSRADTADRNGIKQVLNRVQFGIGFENIAPNPRVDYAIKTRIKTLKTYLDVSETDWESNFSSFFPITPKFTAILAADAYMTQRTDSVNVNEHRNMFRVKPAFKFNTDYLTITVGMKAVNEYEESQKINYTRGFPTADITYKHPSGIAYFVGYDGDFERHTLSGLLQENRWLAQQITLRNTEKNKEIYVGVKGEMPSTLSYNLKTSFNEFRNLYFFNGSQADTSKFTVLYDSTKVKVWAVNMQLSYNPASIWRTTFNANFNKYKPNQYEKALHRPNMILNWTNSLVFSEKLVIGTQLYYLSSTYSKNITKNELVKNNSILDLNAEIDYLFLKRLSTFVRINNILGKKYERFTNYQQQGLNFLVGLNFSL